MKLTGKLLIGAAIAIKALAFYVNRTKHDNVLYIYNWTYYTPKDVVESFEKEYNCKVILDEYTSNEEMYNKIKNGASNYDIVVPSQDFVKIMIDQGMLKELDSSLIPNKQYINTDVMAKATHDPNMAYAVPYYFGAAGISVNKTKVPEDSYSRDWSIFADKKFKGHATMMDDMREVIGDALVHNGHSVCSVNDEELNQAFHLVNDEWKPNLVKFDAEAFGKSFAEGDFWLCQGYAEVVFGEVPEEKWEETIDFFIPEEGGPAYLDSMCILRDSEHADLAHKFINYMCEPKNYAKFLDFFHFPCFVNTEAPKYMTTKPMYEASQMKNCELKSDIGEDLYKYNDLWEKIRFGTD